MRGLIALPIAALATTSAFAQNSTQEAIDSRAIGEIIVTAEKRQGTAQTTPIAIDVVTGDKLLENGVTDMKSLESIAPGIQFGQNFTGSIITVRGVSGRDTTEIGDPAVAVNVDGVFLQRPTGMNASLFDLERIEVLRGPQGTLYGRNATGGVINIISKKPVLGELSGYASVSYGNYSALDAEGAINIPLSDNLALRASFISKRHKGYWDNSPSPTGDPAVDIPSVGGPSARANYRGDELDTEGGRLQLLFEPSEALKFHLTASYVHEGGAGPAQIGLPTNNVAPPQHFSEVKHFALSTQGDLDLTRKNLVAETEYDFGPATLTYIFGLVKLDVDHLADQDGTDYIYYNFRRGEYSTDLSHELRIASNGNGPFSWQVGGFLYDQDLRTSSLNYVDPNGDAIVLRNFLYDVDVKSRAVFGQISYEIASALKLSAGVRYSRDTKHRGGGFWGGPGLVNPPSVQPDLVFIDAANSTNRSKDSAVTYHFGADYQWSPNNLLYAKVDKGYKSGGFTTINAYGPEYVVSYEVGSKNKFFGNTLQLNVSAFLYDYTDQQVSQTTPQGAQVLNAGTSRIKGVELQGDWRVTSADKLDFSVNWLDAKFKNFQVRAGNTNVDLSGNRLIQSPKWVISGGYEHTFDVGSGGQLVPRVQFIHRSSAYLTFFNRPNDRQRAYTMFDASLTYRSPDDSWSLQAYGRNLTNKIVITQANIGSFLGANTYQLMAPRTYGVRFTANF
ncbi:TonB-dependent receptor [Novosphingobium mathurense]|uniref:Iron complex outermembrane recepter protein n=1 Tax=Novosphingobium mathurense TaxID=428990 RepID=A0A1U6IXS2_9SPHN|nr:TonB-dependent receptor [Novosphingobium mathurense]SLK12814.1 iron complex outermembrane recepter protein [Novosphingobium mathurense]